MSFESILRCHGCEPCRRGDFNQCERAVLLGLERDGLFGTTVDVPAQLAHDVSDLAERPGGLQAAACLEPAACALLACTAARVTPGDAVLIFGAGPLGLFTAMVCRAAFGASVVHVVEPVALRRELAARWADECHDVDAFFSGRREPRFDVVVETSGALDNVGRVLKRVAPRGRVVLLARSGRALSIDAVDHLISAGISIVGSRGHLGGAFSDVLRLVRAGRLPLQDAVTEVVDGLAELAERLRAPRRVLEQHCKVLARLGPGAAGDSSAPAEPGPR